MARKSRKKHAEEHESNERWLVTYSDLITLLLAFFVVMFSFSKVDSAKYAQLAQSLQSSLNPSISVMPQGGGGSNIIGTFNPESDEDKEKNGNGDADKTHVKSGDTDEEAKEAALALKEKELQDLLKVINGYIDENHLEATVSAVDTSRGISVTLKDYFLFDLGKADLKPEAYPLLDQLASLIPTLNSQISIEGHTDNLPLTSGAYYKDNWRLSSERSLSVLRYFTDVRKMPRDEFQSVAYADTKPVAANDTSTNRAKNRRVEIVVLR